MKTSQVYFIECSGRIKIGHSRDVQARLRKFATGSAFKFSLVGAFDGGRNLEKAIHRHLKDHHVHGEWFTDCEAVRSVYLAIRDGGPSAIGFTEQEGASPETATEPPTPALVAKAQDSVLRPAWVRIEACAERYVGEHRLMVSHYSGERAWAAMQLVNDTTDCIEDLLNEVEASRGAVLRVTLDDILPRAMAFVARLEIATQRLFENPDVTVIDVTAYEGAVLQAA